MRSITCVILVFTAVSLMPGNTDAFCNSPYCPPPWLAFQGHCYLWVDIPMPWMDAERYCQMLSHPGKMVHLASVNNSDEDEFIGEFVKKSSGFHPNPQFWIGLSDIELENHFKWNDGSDVLYTGWIQGEPNQSGDEDCVERRPDTRMWNDKSCNANFRFVCKM